MTRPTDLPAFDLAALPPVAQGVLAGLEASGAVLDLTAAVLAAGYWAAHPSQGDDTMPTATDVVDTYRQIRDDLTADVPHRPPGHVDGCGCGRCTARRVAAAADKGAEDAEATDEA